MHGQPHIKFIYRLDETRELFLDPLTSSNENKFVEHAMFIQPNGANFLIPGDLIHPGGKNIDLIKV